MKKKISIVFGTRPEAIKLCPLVFELRKHPELNTHVCVTGQHRQMLDQVLSAFEISPDVDLDLMTDNQGLGEFASNALRTLDSYYLEYRPHMLLVQGDTTTAFAALLTAFYHRIPSGHVEAGLRTWKKYYPFPEEMNRVLAAQLADYHFCPTNVAKNSLLKEGIPADRIYVTGNTIVDALHLILKRIKTENLEPQIVRYLTSQIPQFESFVSNPLVRIILVTGHRRENFGSGLRQICAALTKLSKRKDVAIVYPVHLNPRVHEPVTKILGNKPRIHLIEPLDYIPFIYLMSRSYLILTDSGGIQEEAPSLGIPVLVMRDFTERPEPIEAGTAKLVGADEERIVQGAERLLDDENSYKAMSLAHNPYGNGNAARIIAALCGELVNF
jgi:UDP-N-acetylglucosamine 2-epimerase (non-hydrolysing)